MDVKKDKAKLTLLKKRTCDSDAPRKAIKEFKKEDRRHNGGFPDMRGEGEGESIATA